MSTINEIALDTTTPPPQIVHKKIIVKKKLVKPQTKRDKLPITNYEHDFIKRLEREKILVVEASTGSGKSTQLPQYVAKSDLFQSERRLATAEKKYSGGKSPLGLPSQGKMVVSTQPNAFAAAAVATRVGFEYDNDVLGRKVGLITPTEYKFDSATCEILFVSDSELVRIMTQDKLLSRVGVLIIDEAHERTLYTDVIMSLSKEIRQQRDDFYIVISSATIEVKSFLRFMFNLQDLGTGSSAIALKNATAQLGFRPTSLLVQGKTYEVRVEYDPLEVRDPTKEKDPYLAQFLTPKIVSVLRRFLKPEIKGHALVFVEDTHTVLRVVHHLRRYLRLQTKLAIDKGLDPKLLHGISNSENTRVIPLYLSMPLKEQQKIMDFVRSFQSKNGQQQMRYVFIADHIAETSITLPDVKLVIDTGRMMVSSFDMIRRLMVTEETFVSKDRAQQRQGRTGRTGPGICVRLYHESDLKLDRVEPDIKRVALDKVALQLAAMNINPKALRLIEPPDEHKFIFAIEQLIQYGCLTTNAQQDYSTHLEITEKGKVFVQLPFSPDTCEQLWQASLISAEATSVMHAISCLFNNESSNIFEHSAGLTWKQLAEQVIDERPFYLDAQVGLNNNMLASQHWSPLLNKIKNPNPNDTNWCCPTYDGLTNKQQPLIVTYNPDLKHKEGKFADPTQYVQPPHLWFNPFWQTDPTFKFGFNLNSGSDLELGYLMYVMLMHYRKPNCTSCAKCNNGQKTDEQMRQDAAAIAAENDDDANVLLIKEKHADESLNFALGADDDDDIPDANAAAAASAGTSTDYKRVALCQECEQHFRDVYHVLPQAITQAENFIRSTRDLVHRSLSRNYLHMNAEEKALYEQEKRTQFLLQSSTQAAPTSTKTTSPTSSSSSSSTTTTAVVASPNSPLTAATTAAAGTTGGLVLYGTPKKHPHDFTISKIITQCIYTALSHMAGVVLVTNHLSEGVVLPHKYFKMVKANIDANACSNTVDTYYKLVTIPENKRYKTHYTCVKHFIVVHVTARQAHDYNITCLHPFELYDLDAQTAELFSAKLADLQLQQTKQFRNIGRGLYSSIDYILTNQRIDNMARQYDLERAQLREQQYRQSAGADLRKNQDNQETQRTMDAMNWSRFAAIPIQNGVMSVWTLTRYREDTQRRIHEIIITASRHMVHLYERERRSYRLPLSSTMFADVILSHDYKIKELIINSDGKAFSVRPEDLISQYRHMGRNNYNNNGGVPSIVGGNGIQNAGVGMVLGTKSQQVHQVGLSKNNTPAITNKTTTTTTTSDNEQKRLEEEFGGKNDDNIAHVVEDALDIEQLWANQADYDQFDDYAAALEDNDDDDSDIEMLPNDDDGDDSDIIMLDGDDHVDALINKALNKNQTTTTTTTNTPLLEQPVLLQQRSVNRLPSGNNTISEKYQTSVNRHQNEIAFSRTYDPLQTTRFKPTRWFKHDKSKEYQNTLTLSHRISFSQDTIFNNLCKHYDLVHNNNTKQPTTSGDEDLLRTISPLNLIYQKIHRIFEDILEDLKLLHEFQYFPLVPEFSDYDDIVLRLYDQSTALINFAHNSDDTSGASKMLERFAIKEENDVDNANVSSWFAASLTDIQGCFNSLMMTIEKNINLKNPDTKNPHELTLDELHSILSFKCDIFVQIHCELGPRDLISWIQLAPRTNDLFDISTQGLRRFIAPGKRHQLVPPILSTKYETLGQGCLIDAADLRLIQCSEEEVRQYCLDVMKKEGDVELLYTLSATIDHSEIINVDNALQRITHALRDKYGKLFRLDILERVDLLVNQVNSNLKNPHMRTQITFSGSQTSVVESAAALVKIGEAQQVPLGPLTNSNNALLNLLLSTTGGLQQWKQLVTKHELAVEYLKHGSDGSLHVWGDARGVMGLTAEYAGWVAEFDRRRRAFPLPHNIFADLKNDNENSPYYSAFQLLQQQIDRLTKKTAKYELKTDETAFILECQTAQELTACLQPLRGFKLKCGIEEQEEAQALTTPCMICLQTTTSAATAGGGNTVQRLSSCDHAICSSCLTEHVTGIIKSTRQAQIDKEFERQQLQSATERVVRVGNPLAGGAGDLGECPQELLDAEGDDEQTLITKRKKRQEWENERNIKLYGNATSTITQDETYKLQQELAQPFNIDCPCYYAHTHQTSGAAEYFSQIAALTGIQRKTGSTIPQPGEGCRFKLLPADMVRICTPSQIHQILFLLAKPVMKATNAYLPCPSGSCTTLLPLKPYYQHCSRCSLGYCTQCNVTNSTLHDLIPCHIFKAILSYHDAVLQLFGQDSQNILHEFTSSGKNGVDVSNALKGVGSHAAALLAPYVPQELQLRVQIATLMLKEAQRWLDADWIKNSHHNKLLIQKSPQIFMNPGIFTHCGAYVRFMRGIRQQYRTNPAFFQYFEKGKNIPFDCDTKTHYALLSQLISSGNLLFAYHGTPHAKNVAPIMHDGLDPKFRSGQAHGAGEYLGVSPSVSFDYGREYFLITAFLNHPDLYHFVSGFCYVIKNPVDFKSQYCFPLGVIRVSDTRNPCIIAKYPAPSIKESWVKVSTAAWLSHLRLDPQASVARAIYDDEKLRDVNGVKSDGQTTLDISLHQNGQVWEPPAQLSTFLGNNNNTKQ